MAPLYSYRAKDMAGRYHQGLFAAPGQKETLAHLHSRNLCVIDITENPGFFTRLLFLWRRRFGFPDRAKSREYMIFCRQFAVMLQAGIPALNALHVLIKQIKLRHFRERLQEAALSLEKGGSLSAAFQRQGDYFPAIMISMIAVGETGGSLDKVMERLAGYFDKQNELEEKIHTATIYPYFISGVALAVLAVLIVFVLPQFSRIFDTMGLEMPLFARVMLASSLLARRYWPLLAALLPAAAAAAFLYGRSENWRCHWDRWRLCLPFFGSLYRHTLAARFSRTMEALLDSGVNLLDALELVDRVADNRVLSGAINRTREAINRGQPIAAPLQASGLFPDLLVEMVRVGEESGALVPMLERTASFYEREISRMVERLGAMLEPILLLIIGTAVGLLVFSIISPIYRVFQVI